MKTYRKSEWSKRRRRKKVDKVAKKLFKLMKPNIMENRDYSWNTYDIVAYDTKKITVERRILPDKEIEKRDFYFTVVDVPFKNFLDRYPKKLTVKIYKDINKEKEIEDICEECGVDKLIFYYD